MKLTMNGAQATPSVVATKLGIKGWCLGLAMDSSGNFYISETQSNHIKKVTVTLAAAAPMGSTTTAAPVSTSQVTVIAGVGTKGFSGDGGPAVSAQLNRPAQLSIDPSGNIYFADRYNNVIRKLTPAAGGGYTISTVYGQSGAAGFAGDGGPAASAKFSQVVGIVMDAAGNMYVSDTGNAVIRMITPTGTITTIAGTPNKRGFSTNNGTALGARLVNPHLLAISNTGIIYAADTDGNRVLELTPAQ
jgi:sugar lactone lactonase YvrE